jgi:hypothetical protein
VSALNGLRVKAPGVRIPNRPGLFYNTQEGEVEGLIEGRIVHYILDREPNRGQHRAAMVTRVLNPDTGAVNLAVFKDGTNDGAGAFSLAGYFYAIPLEWRTSVLFDAKALTPGTWHWTEKVPGVISKDDGLPIAPVLENPIEEVL